MNITILPNDLLVDNGVLQTTRYKRYLAFLKNVLISGETKPQLLLFEETDTNEVMGLITKKFKIEGDITQVFEIIHELDPTSFIVSPRAMNPLSFDNLFQMEQFNNIFDEDEDGRLVREQEYMISYKLPKIQKILGSARYKDVVTGEDINININRTLDSYFKLLIANLRLFDIPFSVKHKKDKETYIMLVETENHKFRYTTENLDGELDLIIQNSGITSNLAGYSMVDPEANAQQLEDLIRTIFRKDELVQNQILESMF